MTFTLTRSTSGRYVLSRCRWCHACRVATSDRGIEMWQRQHDLGLCMERRRRRQARFLARRRPERPEAGVGASAPEIGPERRGDDGLTDRERRALAAEWRQREGSAMTAQQYRLNPPQIAATAFGYYEITHEGDTP